MLLESEKKEQWSGSYWIWIATVCDHVAKRICIDMEANDRFAAAPLRRNSSFRRLIKAWASSGTFIAILISVNDS